MKAKTIFMTLLLSVVSLSVFAQNEQGGRRSRMNTTEMYNRQAERLVKQMKLDDEKKDLFTILYLDYQAARHNAANPKGANEGQERVNMKELTDEKALELINKQFDANEARLKVDKEYLPKFLEIITPAQAANVFLQMRNGRGENNGERPQGFPGGGGFGGPGGGFGGQGGGFGGPGF